MVKFAQEAIHPSVLQEIMPHAFKILDTIAITLSIILVAILIMISQVFAQQKIHITA